VIVTPSSQQWREAFANFSGGDELKIVVLADGASWRAARGEDLVDADVILLGYDIQGAVDYSVRLHCLTPGHVTGGLAAKLAHLAENRASSLRTDALAEEGPVFQLFRFRRVVLDEFQDIDAWTSRTRFMYERMAADHRWGLARGVAPSLTALAGTLSLLGSGTLAGRLSAGATTRCNNEMGEIFSD
jgi:hypothetical protein